MNIVAIIPARGGSKSIPRKNVKLLGDKPLIAYPIELAKSIPEINKVIVSTDDSEIKSVALKSGAEVPFLRPEELAKDETPTIPVLQHCVKYLEEHDDFKVDLILLLYPTCPFLKKETVMKAIDKFKEGYNSVISVSEDYGRYWVKDKNQNQYIVLYPKKRVNRQYYDPLYKENGAIYFSNYNTIMNGELVDNNSIGFIIMSEDELVDIDTISDWKKAEDLLKNENN